MDYPHTLTLRETTPVTHDTYRFVFDRPEDFKFESGQATHVAFDRDGWRDVHRPFTMSSQPEETDRVEYIIKVYPEHDEPAMTKEMPKMQPGDKLLSAAPAGAITDKGAGTFIAGGAGVTPFITILRRRAQDGTLDGCRLLYSNKTEADIILREEWEAMDGLETVFTVTDQEAPADVETGKIDAAFLEKHAGGTDRPFYICGPRPMVNDIREALKSIGVPEDNIVTEKGW